MKNILRSISVIAATALILPVFIGIQTYAATGVKIDSTKFPDANFRTIVKTYDTDKNGYLSDKEITLVRNIYCQGKGIKSLTSSAMLA